jgi:pSer/pThr/pTyr-binding forkhead associated (FHA) protein
MVMIKDIGSNGGTFVNNKRLSDPGIPSENVLLKTGDLIQLGKDHLEDAVNLDENGRIQGTFGKLR